MVEIARIEVFDQLLGARKDAVPVPAFSMEMAQAEVSVRNIIEQRVALECDAPLLAIDHEAAAPLIEPGLDLRLKDAKPDVAKAKNIALEAFRNNAFFFIWNGVQVESLDEKVNVMRENEAIFLRLIPLRGG
ncbi:hypothetical protein ACFQ14_11985 [Pseudahrensia aquimaris]|uniref:Uncharacterized protein n=1 Tax=Pseudahrensia aquimaris TaxID=744461 RepID=A0ABW3FJW3_9HYPH